MDRVVHFEIHADDPSRAIQFYEDVFGWEIRRWDGPSEYWLVTTGPDERPGINGGILRRQDPSASVHNTIEVKNLDQAIHKIKQNGGTVVVAKIAIPRVGWLAYFKDTEGNMFGIMQTDPKAK
jgi:predicted enzyme related to lactoylglutathione lyase